MKPSGHFVPFIFSFQYVPELWNRVHNARSGIWSVGQPGEVAGPAGLALCTFGTDQVTPPVTTAALPTKIGVVVTHPAKSTRDKLF